jgi:hypothetical protein
MNLRQGGGGLIRRLPTLCFRSVREGGGGREGHRRHGPDQDHGELNAELTCSVCRSVAESQLFLRFRFRLSTSTGSGSDSGSVSRP